MSPEEEGESDNEGIFLIYTKCQAPRFGMSFTRDCSCMKETSCGKTRVRNGNHTRPPSGNLFWWCNRSAWWRIKSHMGLTVEWWFVDWNVSLPQENEQQTLQIDQTITVPRPPLSDFQGELLPSPFRSKTCYSVRYLIPVFILLDVAPESVRSSLCNNNSKFGTSWARSMDRLRRLDSPQDSPDTEKITITDYWEFICRTNGLVNTLSWWWWC